MRLPSLTQLVRVILNSVLHTVSFQALEQELSAGLHVIARTGLVFSVSTPL
jgi:hypothetical protein